MLQEIDTDLSNQESALTWHVPPTLNLCHRHISEQFNEFTRRNVPAWRISGQQSIEKAQYRAAYNSTLKRSSVKFLHEWPNFFPKGSELTNKPVPCIKSDDGFAMYFFPFFVAIGIGQEFGLLSPLNVTLKQIEHSFSVVEEQPPIGVRISDYTYKYVNKDGSPDLRFRDNPRIPIVTYDEIEISISGGPSAKLHFPADLNNDLFCSNFYGEAGGSWKNYCNWFRYANLLSSFENVQITPVKWELRHEPANGKDSSMDYIAASFVNGDEFFTFAFAHEAHQFWLGLSGKPLDVLFRAADFENDARATDVKIWLDDEPMDIACNQYVSKVTPEQANFKVLGLLLDSSGEDSPIKKLLKTKQILIYICNGISEHTLFRLPLEDAQPLMIELVNRSSIAEWKF